MDNGRHSEQAPTRSRRRGRRLFVSVGLIAAAAVACVPAWVAMRRFVPPESIRASRAERATERPAMRRPVPPGTPAEGARRPVRVSAHAMKVAAFEEAKRHLRSLDKAGAIVEFLPVETAVVYREGEDRFVVIGNVREYEDGAPVLHDFLVTMTCDRGAWRVIDAVKPATTMEMYVVP